MSLEKILALKVFSQFPSPTASDDGKVLTYDAASGKYVLGISSGGSDMTVSSTNGSSGTNTLNDVLAPSSVPV